VNGKSLRLDCNAIGHRCSAVADAVDPMAACMSSDGGTRCGGDECNGDVLKSCGQGHIFEVNCRGLGLGSCTTSKIDSLFATCSAP
jgi:hypothetical protein